MLSPLDQAGLVAEERAESCCRYQFELFDALEKDAPLGTRLAILAGCNATCRSATAIWGRAQRAGEPERGDAAPFTFRFHAAWPLVTAAALSAA